MLLYYLVPVLIIQMELYAVLFEQRYRKDFNCMERKFFVNCNTQCCGAEPFCRIRLKCTGFGLLLCDLGVQWWQSCDNSYNFSQIITIFTQIERKNRETFKKGKIAFLYLSKLDFLFQFV